VLSTAEFEGDGILADTAVHTCSILGYDTARSDHAAMNVHTCIVNGYDIAALALVGGSDVHR
jgi:hypothetical protein